MNMSMLLRGDRSDVNLEQFAPLSAANVDIAAALRNTLTVQALWKRRFMLGAVTAGALLVGGAYLATRTLTYGATTSVLVGGATLSLEGQRMTASARGDIKDITSRLQHLTAEKARLEAEATGQDEIRFPDELAHAADDVTVKDVMHGQTLLFELGNKAVDDRRRMLMQSQQLYKDEVASLTKQVEFSAIQQNLIDEELKGVRDLADKGLASMTRQRDLERTAAVLASRKIEIETQLLDRRQKIVEAEQELADITTKRRTDAMSRIQEIDGEARSARARLEQARSVATLASAGGAVDSAGVENAAEIIRSDVIGNKVVEAAALHQDDAFLFGGASSASDEERQSDLLRRQRALELLQSNLVVERIGRGSRIDITYVSPDSAQAAKIADTYAAAYVQNSAPDSSEMPGTGAQVLRQASIEQRDPRALNVLAAMVFASLVIGPGIAFVLEFMHRMKSAGAREADQPGLAAGLVQNAPVRSGDRV